MSKHFCIDNISLNYLSYDEIEDHREELNELYELYKFVYNVADFLCQQLEIKIPDIAFLTHIRGTIPLPPFEVVKKDSLLYYMDSHPELDNSLILLSLEKQNCYSLTATISREIRHLWQCQNAPELMPSPAITLEQALNYPAEIDADAFAIWNVSQTPGIHTLEAAATIVCQHIKVGSKAYKKRLNLARQMKQQYNKPYILKPNWR